MRMIDNNFKNLSNLTIKPRSDCLMNYSYKNYQHIAYDSLYENQSIHISNLFPCVNGKICTSFFLVILYVQQICFCLTISVSS